VAVVQKLTEVWKFGEKGGHAAQLDHKSGPKAKGPLLP